MVGGLAPPPSRSGAILSGLVIDRMVYAVKTELRIPFEGF